MSSEPTLAYTVHHKGRKYRLGMTAEEVGPVAGEFGAHVWVGGKAPAKTSIPKEGDPDGGSRLGTPPVPTPSGLPGPGSAAEIAAATGTEVGTAVSSGGDVEAGPGDGSGSAPKKATGGARRGGSGSGS